MPDHPTTPARFGGCHWAAPAYLDYVHPPLTDADVAAAEALLGVRLPQSYLVLLRQQNGGYLRGAWPGTVQHTLFGIGAGFPSITTHEAWWKAPQAGDGWAPRLPGLLVPFDGDGHWDMCFDYRDCGPQGDPAVTHIDLEAEEDRQVAGSFDAYLDGLVDDDSDAALRLYGDATVDGVAAALAAAFGKSVDDQGAFAHGYRVLRIAMPGQYEWCWLSANVVPRGFRRVGRRLDATPELTLRFNEDPACRVIVSSTEASQAAVQAAVVAAGFLLTRPDGLGG
jgi:SMI1 / KNR4 family (SUKH-1)